jgi:hypothetical protein
MEQATLVTTQAVGERDERRAKPLARYEEDIHAWALQQADLLRAGRFAELDLINLADEVADVGHSAYDKLESDLARIIQHLLKWDHQPDRRSRSWVSSIREHRRRVTRQLERVPSLKARQTEALEEAYDRGRGDALIETGLDESALPGARRYDWDEVMNRPILWAEP